MPTLNRMLAALLVLWAGTAWGHVTSTAVATLDVRGNGLVYRVTIEPSGIDDLYVPILTAGGDPVHQALRQYARFSIAGEACMPTRTAVVPSADKVVLEMALLCAQSAGTLHMRDDWPEVLGAHVQTVMTVTVAGGVAGQFVFIDDRREASLELQAPAGHGLAAFVRMGAGHILGGPDHLLFLLALLATARGLWPAVKIVTGFTVAHSITLSLAVLGWVDVPARLVEPLIAASIVWVAAENLLGPRSAGHRWLIAVLFGLVHGLGFAGGLLELGLPRAALVPALVGFNAGVELGQLAFVVAAMPLVVWLAKLPRFSKLPQILSAAVGAMGVVWFVERVL